MTKSDFLLCGCQTLFLLNNKAARYRVACTGGHTLFGAVFMLRIIQDPERIFNQPIAELGLPFWEFPIQQ